MTSSSGDPPAVGSPPSNPPQAPSAFRSILSALVDAVSGVRAAALVDGDGETVDYASRGDPFVVRVTAAHLRIVLDDVRRRPSFSHVRQLVVRAARARFVVYGLPDGYALVLRLAPGADLVERARRPLSDCALRLGSEAGWPRDGMEPWHSAEVRTGERGRPVAVGAGAPLDPIEILGHLTAGLRPGERGWRIRFRTGVEATLVRERAGRWYADEPFDLSGGRLPGSAPHGPPRKTR